MLFLSSDLSANALGRSYSLWLCAQQLGWEVRVRGPADGPLWAPLRSTAFADACRPTPPGRRAPPTLFEDASWAELLVAVKELPPSLGTALRLVRTVRRPVLLDIDDPDLDVARANLSRRARLGLVHPRHVLSGHHPYQLSSLRRRSRSLPCMTSNPSLQARHGGVVVPHARPPGPSPLVSAGVRPVVTFIGTPQPYKGVEILREAVSRLSGRGYTLRITATPDGPVPPWEDWVGETTLERGLAMVAGGDIVALPSLHAGYAPAQLPVKLIDAMLAGRAIVASDLAPMRWALGGAGVLVEPGSVEDLARGLLELEDPKTRSDLGTAARRRALDRFIPATVAPALAAAAEATWETSRQQ